MYIQDEAADASSGDDASPPAWSHAVRAQRGPGRPGANPGRVRFDAREDGQDSLVLRAREERFRESSTGRSSHVMHDHDCGVPIVSSQVLTPTCPSYTGAN